MRLQNFFARLLYLVFGPKVFVRSAVDSFLFAPVEQVLLICSGNICRSAYAEAQLKKLLGKNDSIKVASRGLFTTPGKPADPMAIEVAKSRGIDLAGHRTQSVSEKDLEEYPLLLLMDDSHRAAIAQRGRKYLAKSVYLGAFGMHHGGPLLIADPFGRSAEVFRECFDEIDQALRGFLETVAEKTK